VASHRASVYYRRPVSRATNRSRQGHEEKEYKKFLYFFVFEME
jgi:hypothetical protein